MPAREKLQQSTPYGQASIAFFDRGAMIRSNIILPGNPTGKGGGERSNVTEWTAASRRRFRDWLVSHRPPVGWPCWAFSLTIPGPPVSGLASKIYYDNFAKTINRAGGCTVWRMEVQQRGSIHFHGMATVPPDYEPKNGSGSVSSHPSIGHLWLRDSWLSVLSDEVENWPLKCKNGDTLLQSGKRRDLIGAEKRAFKGSEDNGSATWYRYMSDHASKLKCEQVASDAGRHWGVTSRSRWVECEPSVEPMDPHAFARFRRAYSRLCSPQLVKRGVPFGRAVSRRERLKFGTTATFTDTATLRRLYDWAVAGRAFSCASLPGAERLFWNQPGSGVNSIL